MLRPTNETITLLQFVVNSFSLMVRIDFLQDADSMQPGDCFGFIRGNLVFIWGQSREQAESSDQCLVLPALRRISAAAGWRLTRLNCSLRAEIRSSLRGQDPASGCADAVRRDTGRPAAVRSPSRGRYRLPASVPN